MEISPQIRAVTAALLLSTQLASAGIPEKYAGIPVIQQIAAQLEAQGYEIIDVKKTFLGRFKIDAVAPGFEREIIIAAGGGTILRDAWHEAGPTTQGDDIVSEAVSLDQEKDSSPKSGGNDNSVDDGGSH